MRFAGDDDLNRHFRVVEDFLQARDIAEQECCSFVSGKATGEADGENVGIENFLEAADFGSRRFALKDEYSSRSLFPL